MKIVITNTVVLNGGDAAILFGTMRILQEAFGDQVRFAVFDSQPEAAARYYPDIAFRPSLYSHTETALGLRSVDKLLKPWQEARWRLAAARPLSLPTDALLGAKARVALHEYASADVIVSTGGTYLVENYSLEHRLFDFEISLLLGKPLVLFTQSLGPFAKPENRRRLKGIFKRAALVLVREELSRRHIADLGISPERIRVSADAAFALADSLPATRCDADVGDAKALRVAISVREWHHFRTTDAAAGMANYLAVMSSVVQYLVQNHRASVTFVSTCQGIPEYWADDSRVAAEIARGLPPHVRDSVEVDRAFYSPKDLIGRLRKYDLLVATRMHMAILGFCAGVPVLGIAYEFKTTELFRYLGLGEWTHDIETLRSESLRRSADSLIARLAEVRAAILRAVDRERRRAADSGCAVRAAVLGQPLLSSERSEP